MKNFSLVTNNNGGNENYLTTSIVLLLLIIPFATTVSFVEIQTMSGFVRVMLSACICMIENWNKCSKKLLH